MYSNCNFMIKSLPVFICSILLQRGSVRVCLGFEGETKTFQLDCYGSEESKDELPGVLFS